MYENPITYHIECFPFVCSILFYFLFNKTPARNKMGIYDLLKNIFTMKGCWGM